METITPPLRGVVNPAPLRIYTGLLGQIGDIIAFTPAVRRLKELFPNSQITFAVSDKYREAGELTIGLPYIDRLFVVEHYFERLSSDKYTAWDEGWPVELRGDDEIEEQRKHDLVFETRPRHRRERWWEHNHLTDELAHSVGIPGPIDPRTEVAIPPGARAPDNLSGKFVFHNDPGLSEVKAWSWTSLSQCVDELGPGNCVILGGPAGPTLTGTVDLRNKTTLSEAAAIMAASRCFVGIDSGLMWIAGSLSKPAVGILGTAFIPNCRAVQPYNPNAVYIQTQGPAVHTPIDAVMRAIDHVIGNRPLRNVAMNSQSALAANPVC